MSEMTFGSVKDAVRWAEEMATIPDMGSCLGSLMSKTTSGSNTRQDLIDIALTISSVVQNLSAPYSGIALKAVYSGKDRGRDRIIAEILAEKMSRTKRGSRKVYKMLVSLGLATVKAERARQLYGDRYPIRRMAYDVGVSRETFTRSVGWPVLRATARDQLLAWISQGESLVWVELRDRGWVA